MYKFDNITGSAIEILAKPTFNNLMKVAIDYSDALIIGSEDLPKDIEKHLSESEKPVLDYKNKDEFSEAYTNFYNTEVLS